MTISNVVYLNANKTDNFKSEKAILSFAKNAYESAINQAYLVDFELFDINKENQIKIDLVDFALDNLELIEILINDFNLTSAQFGAFFINSAKTGKNGFNAQNYGVIGNILNRESQVYKSTGRKINRNILRLV